VTKSMIIRQLARFPQTDSSDELNFQPGVNVIVGPSGAGKSQWLRMLDYLMGDAGPAAQAFNSELVNKYESMRAIIQIGDEEYTFERHWKKDDVTTKVFVDGEAINAKDLSAFILEKLEMPQLHFQSGGLMSARGWVHLTWRILLRHIYRKPTSWSEIANKQPDQEQHACLLMFTGLADTLFSAERKELAEKRRRLIICEAEKDQFMGTLQRIAKDLFDEQELAVGLTPTLIEKAIERLRLEATNINQRRSNRLETLQNETAQEKSENLEHLKERWAALQAESEEILLQIERAQNRLNELTEYRDTVRAESEKLARATSAAQVFDDLRVTHCPVCHKPVKKNRFEEGLCFVCGQPDEIPEFEEESSKRRLEFEREQLNAETAEANDLVSRSQANLKALETQRQSIEESGRQLDVALRPIRQAVSALRDPEISLLEREYGAIEERINQLIRAQASLRSRRDFNEEIKQLQQEIGVLLLQVESMDITSDRNSAGDILTDSMREYLSAIKILNPSSWTLNEDIRFWISQSGFGISVNGQSWETRLGDTHKLYFLLAYNYALLDLTRRSWAHYPGITILDLPPKLEDDSTVTDKENFVLQPFVELLEKPDMQHAQLICAGSAFQNLKGINRIVLDKVWI
jgi:energy-coupling factor transporter ATP-binding protein EcfA2